MPDTQYMLKTLVTDLLFEKNRESSNRVSYLFLKALSQCLLQFLLFSFTLHVILLEPINFSLRAFWSFVFFILVTVFRYLRKTSRI